MFFYLFRFAEHGVRKKVSLYFCL